MKRLLSMLVTIMLMSPSAMLLAQDEVYGWQLMSEQERAEHRAKMQNMNTEEERERYRTEHHKKMQERAKQQGVTLPDEPQDRLRNRSMDKSHDGKGPMGGSMGGSGGGKR